MTARPPVSVVVVLIETVPLYSERPLPVAIGCDDLGQLWAAPGQDGGLGEGGGA